MRLTGLVLIGLLCGCAASTGVAGAPVPALALRPEDRVVLGDFSRVTAIAASFDRVFVAYPTAIALWRPIQKHWDVPRSPADPALLRDVISGMIDPVDQSLWLATTTGWIHYQYDIDRWEAQNLGVRVGGIALDASNPSGGLWIRTSTGWLLQPRVGPATPAAPPASLRMTPGINDAFADIPQLRSLAPRVLTGPRMGQGSFTAAAPNSQGTGWYLGTSNRGLLFFDRTAVEATPMTFGLPGTVVGAVVAVAGGVWVANDLSPTSLPAVTFLSEDLSTSLPVGGSALFGLPFDRARQILPGDRALWLGTDKGVLRVSLDDAKLSRWATGDGLPDDRVPAMAQVHGQVVAGTMRGLVDLRSDSVLPRARSYQGPVYAMKGNADTLWVGTGVGLYASLPGDDSLRMPEGFRQIGVLPPVLGVGYVGDTLVVMTPDHLVWRDPSTGGWARGPDLSGEVGLLTVFAATTDGVWVGGVRGAALVRPTTGALRPLRVGAELPGEVTAIATSGEFLWVGTSAGLVRIRLVRQ